MVDDTKKIKTENERTFVFDSPEEAAEPTLRGRDSSSGDSSSDIIENISGDGTVVVKEPDSESEQTMQPDAQRPPQGPKVGDRLVGGRYEILSQLGRGAMGVVYRCMDTVAGVEVALKALPPELSHNQEEMEDVRDNFQLVSRLVHQNIAVSKTLERDNSTGDYYLVMECVVGEDLRSWMRRQRRENGGITLEAALPILRQIADALDYAHGRKVMHRDIKPGNVMLMPDGMVKVLDFGLAAQIHSSMSHLSMAYRSSSGTPAYMSPEQWRGKPQGPAADQYSLAVMAYEMLAGHLPFDASDTDVLKKAVLEETADNIEGISDSVNNALQRALSKNAAERFPTCRDFIDCMVNDGFAPPTGMPTKTVEGTATVSDSSLVELKQEVYLLRASIREKKQAIDAANYDRGQTFGSHLDSLARYFNSAEGFMEDSANGDERFTLAQQWYNAALDEAKWINENAPLREQARALLEETDALWMNALDEGADSTGEDIVTAVEELDSARKSYDDGDFQNAVDVLYKVNAFFKHVIDFILKEKGERKGKEDERRRRAIIKFLIIIAISLATIVIGGYKYSEYSEAEKARIEAAAEKAHIEAAKNAWFGKYNIIALSGTKLKMIRVQPGRFLMGSPENELGHDSDETQHWVTLTKDFWLGETEVTQGQWKAVMGGNPSEFNKGDNYPVERVSWDDAMAFCRKLNEKYSGELPSGYKFSLPTEAQWEYACRAGTTTALNNGMNLTSEISCPNLDEVGWYAQNSYASTHPVAQKRPNAWGFYDMHGNVWEWCCDWCGEYNGNATDPKGPSAGSGRVGRGGGWGGYARYCRAADRFGYFPSFRFINLGFRLALVPVQ